MTTKTLKSGMACDYMQHIRPTEAGLPADPGDAPEGGAFCVFGGVK
ncbi:hypothetical protein [Nioella halotolerans]